MIEITISHKFVHEVQGVQVHVEGAAHVQVEGAARAGEVQDEQRPEKGRSGRGMCVNLAPQGAGQLKVRAARGGDDRGDSPQRRLAHKGDW